MKIELRMLIFNQGEFVKNLAFVFGIFGIYAVAQAEATNLTLFNKSGVNVSCAFLQFSPELKSSTVYHWYAIANSESFTFTSDPAQGNITNFRCESDTTTRTWGANGYACVTRTPNYVNPFYDANNPPLCRNLNGEWRSFTRITQSGAARYQLNP